jgi:hypothetical protein
MNYHGKYPDGTQIVAEAFRISLSLAYLSTADFCDFAPKSKDAAEKRWRKVSCILRASIPMEEERYAERVVEIGTA